MANHFVCQACAGQLNLFSTCFRNHKHHLTPINNSYWTETSAACYEINARCHECKLVPQSFHSKCRIWKQIPQILKDIGKPTKVFTRNQEKYVGEKEIHSPEFETITFINPIHREIIHYVKQNPGSRRHTIAQHFNISIDLVHDVLTHGHKLGILTHQSVLYGKAYAYHWSFRQHVGG